MIHLRAHHLFCIQNFVGNGYSKEFVDNMKQVIERLQNGEEVTIVKGTDDLCAFCPHNINGECESENPGIFDNNTEALLPSPFTHNWKALSGYLKQYNNENLEWICQNCQWLSLCLSINHSKEKEQD